MSKIRKSLAEKFQGNKDLAEIFIGEVKNITQSINLLDRLSKENFSTEDGNCLLYTSPSPRDATLSRMPSSA